MRSAHHYSRNTKVRPRQHKLQEDDNFPALLLQFIFLAKNRRSKCPNAKMLCRLKLLLIKEKLDQVADIIKIIPDPDEADVKENDCCDPYIFFGASVSKNEISEAIRFDGMEDLMISKVSEEEIQIYKDKTLSEIVLCPKSCSLQEILIVQNLCKIMLKITRVYVT